MTGTCFDLFRDITISTLTKLARINPQTYKQSHTSTVVQGGLTSPPLGFTMLKYFEKI